jgi:hypothetical protein
MRATEAQSCCLAAHQLLGDMLLARVASKNRHWVCQRLTMLVAALGVLVPSVGCASRCWHLLSRLLDVDPPHLRLTGLFCWLIVRHCSYQVERLQRKFALIHSTLAQQATLQAAPPGVKQSDLTERMSLMSLADSVSLCSFNKVRLPRAPSGSMPPLPSMSQGGTAAAAATAGDSGRDARGQRDGGIKALGSEGSAADGSLKSHSRSGSSAGMLEQGVRQPGSASAAAGALAAGLSKLTGGANGAGDRGLIKSGRADNGASVRAHAVSLSTATLSGQ